MRAAMETEAPPADIAAALERLRIELKYLKDELRELKDADKERAKASRALLVGCVLSFLGPTVGIVWGYSQLTARVDELVASNARADAARNDHELRIRVLEKVRQ
jgi:hypothetical protein